MSKRILFCLLTFLLMTTGCSAEQTPPQSTGNQAGSYVMVYYFHGNFRCSNCHRIEQYTKEAIEQYFKNELDSGKLVFKIVNIDEKQNRHFTEDYQLYTRSVVVSLIKDGKEIKYKNLTEVWNYLRDKAGFLSYIKDEVNKYLKELK